MKSLEPFGRYKYTGLPRRLTCAASRRVFQQIQFSALLVAATTTRCRESVKWSIGRGVLICDAISTESGGVYAPTSTARLERIRLAPPACNNWFPLTFDES